MARPGRGDKTGQQKKKRFLAQYAATGIVSYSCKLAGIARNSFYEWLEKDPVFAERAKDAEKAATELLEKEALRRAVKGVEHRKGVYHAGKKIGTEKIREYSDTLLIFLLKARDPKRYRENRMLELPLPHDGKVTLKVVYEEPRERPKE